LSAAGTLDAHNHPAACLLIDDYLMFFATRPWERCPVNGPDDVSVCPGSPNCDRYLLHALADAAD